MNIHQKISEGTSLAKTYARDGAFHSAARVLNDLAAEVLNHAVWCDELLDKHVKEGAKS